MQVPGNPGVMHTRYSAGRTQLRVPGTVYNAVGLMVPGTWYQTPVHSFVPLF